MARQLMSEKNVRKMRQKTGLDIVKIMVRGNSDHAKDLCLSDGSITRMLKDGAMVDNDTRWQR